jgi:hypothetical protein
LARRGFATVRTRFAFVSRVDGDSGSATEICSSQRCLFCTTELKASTDESRRSLSSSRDQGKSDSALAMAAASSCRPTPSESLVPRHRSIRPSSQTYDSSKQRRSIFLQRVSEGHKDALYATQTAASCQKHIPFKTTQSVLSAISRVAHFALTICLGLWNDVALRAQRSRWECQARLTLPQSFGGRVAFHQQLDLRNRCYLQVSEYAVPPATPQRRA